jgi:hypothetical protein
MLVVFLFLVVVDGVAIVATMLVLGHQRSRTNTEKVVVVPAGNGGAQ